MNIADVFAVDRLIGALRDVVRGEDPCHAQLALAVVLTRTIRLDALAQVGTEEDQLCGELIASALGAADVFERADRNERRVRGESAL